MAEAADAAAKANEATVSTDVAEAEQAAKAKETEVAAAAAAAEVEVAVTATTARAKDAKTKEAQTTKDVGGSKKGPETTQEQVQDGDPPPRTLRTGSSPKGVSRHDPLYQAAKPF